MLSLTCSLPFALLAGCESKPVAESDPKLAIPQKADQLVTSPPSPLVAVPDDVKKLLESPAQSHDRQKEIRKFPFPYQAMLAIASDIDDMTAEEFALIHRFLNTKEQTPYGRGVGLDIADTLWVNMANDKPNVTDTHGRGLESVMTFYQGMDPRKKHDADLIGHFWKKGWIDSIHSFGDFSRKDVKDVVFNRDQAIKAWEGLLAEGIRPQVWINHGNEANKQNFGGYNPSRVTKYQEGDLPGSKYYHTDITVKNGIRFVWNSIGEPEFGHDKPIFPIQLRDGQKVWGFHRHTHLQGKQAYDWTWNPRDLHRQLTKENLDGLVAKHQYSILAQHFGGYNIPFPFDEKDMESLRLLAGYEEQAQILVARTQRLLNYSVLQEFAEYRMVTHDGITWIDIRSIKDPTTGEQPADLENVRGLTFYVDNAENTHVLLKGVPLPTSELQINSADSTGKRSVSVK